jgi:hypothetical protein
LTSFRNALLHFLHIRVWATGQLLLGNPTITHYFLICLDSMIWSLLFMTNIAIEPFAACKTVRTSHCKNCLSTRLTTWSKYLYLRV